MTPKQQRLFEYVRDHIGQLGFAPSYSEMEEAIHTTRGNIARLIDCLVEEGKLVRNRKGGSRNIKLANMPDVIAIPTAIMLAELQRRGEILGALDKPMLAAMAAHARCAVDHCRESVERGHIFCRPHWFRLTPNIQQALKSAHGAGDLTAWQSALARAHGVFARAGMSGQ